MVQLVVCLLLLVLVSSCSPDIQETREEAKAPELPQVKDVSSNDSIRFDFSANWIPDWDHGLEYIIRGKISKPGIIETYASLYNDKTDTVYFLSTTCYGTRSRLWYDTASLYLYSFWHCNATFPVIIAVPPKEQHNFRAHLIADLDRKKIKLGFSFYQFDKKYDLMKLNLLYIYGWGIHGYRTESAGWTEAEGKIVWADEKIIGPLAETKDTLTMKLQASMRKLPARARR